MRAVFLLQNGTESCGKHAAEPAQSFEHAPQRLLLKLEWLEVPWAAGKLK